MFNKEKIEELKLLKKELGKLSTTQVINILGEDIIKLVINIKADGISI